MSAPKGTGPTRIAVVGLGATGILVLMRLVDRLSAGCTADGVELLLFDHNTNLGAGVAYNTGYACHLVNMRISTMSLYEDRPGDFARWLADQHPDVVATADEYVPRLYFAEYLRSTLHETLHRAEESGIAVQLVREEVTDCTETATGTQLTASAAVFDVDYAVLALGDLPSTNFTELRRTSRYLHSPWEFARYDTIDPQDTVCVIGTGLTAIDVLLLLAARGHHGRIVCLTRRSGLPKVQPMAGDHVPHTLVVLTQDTLRRLTNGYTRTISLDEAVQLFESEFEQALGRRPMADYAAAMHAGELSGERSTTRLATDIVDVRAGRVAWYPVLTSTWRIMPHLWRYLDELGKVEFMRRHYSFWGMFRHCVPLRNALRIQALLQSGQLTVRSGLRRVCVASDGLRAELVPHGGRSTEPRCDHLINATGTGYDIARSDSTLLRNMLRRRELRAHPLGGVDVDFDSLRLLDGRTRPSQRIHFIGPLTRGVHFYTNGVEISRVHAERLVDSLLYTVDLPLPAWTGRSGRT